MTERESIDWEREYRLREKHRVIVGNYIKISLYKLHIIEEIWLKTFVIKQASRKKSKSWQKYNF